MFPITKPILERLLEADCDILDLDAAHQMAIVDPLCYQTLFGPTILHYVCSALFLLLFLSFLRVGNLIPRTSRKFDKIRQLDWRRVVDKLPTGVILKVISAKNIQDEKPLETLRNLEKP